MKSKSKKERTWKVENQSEALVKQRMIPNFDTTRQSTRISQFQSQITEQNASSKSEKSYCQQFQKRLRFFTNG